MLFTAQLIGIQGTVLQAAVLMLAFAAPPRLTGLQAIALALLVCKVHFGHTVTGNQGLHLRCCCCRAKIDSCTPYIGVVVLNVCSLLLHLLLLWCAVSAGATNKAALALSVTGGG
jgi:hypothetical protein